MYTVTFLSLPFNLANLFATCTNHGRCKLFRDLILFSESSNAPAYFCLAMDIDYRMFSRPDDWQLIGRWIQLVDDDSWILQPDVIFQPITDILHARALFGHKPIVYCTGKHTVSSTQHYVRTRKLKK